MAKKKVIDLDTYNALDAYTISMHEFYKSLRKAGFSVEICMGIIVERSAYPDWILPSIPDRVDRLPYEDDDED